MSSPPPKRNDLIPRGTKKPSPFGNTIFVGLRGIDPLLQYSILTGAASAPVARLFGSHIISQGPAANTGYAILDNLQLSPYRLILLAMAVGASAKHIFWKLCIGQEEFKANAAVFVSIFNFVANSINTFLFVNAATSLAAGGGEGPHWKGWPQRPLVVGTALFVAGILIETVSEVQRAAFKRKPENKGKPYTGGLFSIARNINYTGYAMWRSGFATAGGGWIAGAVSMAWFSYYFISEAIPELDHYCKQRYADMWNDYCQKTPYHYIPFVY